MAKFICGADVPSTQWDPLAKKPLKDWPKGRPTANSDKPEAPPAAPSIWEPPGRPVEEDGTPLTPPPCIGGPPDEPMANNEATQRVTATDEAPLVMPSTVG